MNQKKRGLGKGLGQLGLQELLNGMEKSVPTTTEGADANEKFSPLNLPSSVRLCDLAIEKIIPGRYQPRKHFDEGALEELASSIKAQGMIQPIIVRISEGEQYELIAGERRWRAAKLAGMDSIPAIVREIGDEAVIAMSLIENIQRKDLNPIEEAMALQRLIEEFELTHQDIAVAIGKSRAAVTNLLRLLKLDPAVKVLLESGELEMGHARTLLAVDTVAQMQIANQVVTKDLSVRETEELVRNFLENKSQIKSTQMQLPQDPNVMSLQNNLSHKLGAKVAIRHGNKGKGKLIIHYNSVDELDGILDRIH